MRLRGLNPQPTVTSLTATSLTATSTNKDSQLEHVELYMVNHGLLHIQARPMVHVDVRGWNSDHVFAPFPCISLQVVTSDSICCRNFSLANMLWSISITKCTCCTMQYACQWEHLMGTLGWTRRV